jgi:hypothetical protein
VTKDFLKRTLVQLQRFVSATCVQFTPFYFKTPIYRRVCLCFFFFTPRVLSHSTPEVVQPMLVRTCPCVPASYSTPELVCASFALSLSVALALSLSLARSLALPLSLSHSAPEVLCASLHVRPCQGECVCARPCVSCPQSQAYQTLICIASLGLFINYANSLLAPLLTPFL